MHRLLGPVVPAVLLVALLGAGVSACGDEEGGTATDDSAPSASESPTEDSNDDPAPTSSESPTTDTDDEAIDHELVETITETAAGGSVSETAVPLSDADAVRRFNEQFETDAMPTRIQDAVARTQVPADMVLYGAVVFVGCDAPTDVTVTNDGSGVQIVAQKVPTPQKECFAAMTTVALVLVPASAV